MTTVKKQNDTTKSLCIEANKIVSQESASNRIPEGWKPLLANVCEEIKQLLLPHNSIDVISYFYPTIRESRLKVFITLDEKIDSVRRDAIISLIDETNMLSEYICHQCGTRATGRKSLSLNHNNSFNLPVCESHSLQLLEEKAEEPQQEKSTKKDWKSLLEEDDKNDKSSTNKIQVYCLKQIKSSLESAPQQYKDSDSRQYITKVLNSLLKGDGLRELVPLPHQNDIIFDSLLTMFPNFEEVIEMLRGASALANISNKHHFPPLLLLGPPGLGKTMFAEELAKHLKVPSSVIRMENQQAGSGLVGSADFWANSKPGEIFNLLINNKVANPIMVVDEVDKALDSPYTPINSLYSLLERHTARSFKDESMPFINLDASHINWILTANNKADVPEAILSRMMTYEIPNPDKDQAKMIATSIYSKMINSSEELSNKLEKEMSDDVLNSLIKLPPRIMKMEIEFAIGRAIIANRNHLTLQDIRNGNSKRKYAMGFIDGN